MQTTAENLDKRGKEPILNSSQRLITDIREVFAPKESHTDGPQEYEPERDVERAVIQCFLKDVQYMIHLFEQNKETYYDKKKCITTLDFRALVQANPNDPLGLPIIIIRPLDSPLRSASRYHNGYSSDMYHDDIWKDWEVLANTKPESERAAIFELLDRESYKNSFASHIYLQIVKNREGKSIVVIEAGWRYFQKQVARRLRPEEYDFELTPKENMVLIKQLSKYNIDAVDLGDDAEPVSVEEVILREMMEPLISANAAKLKTVTTSRAVSEYINLAYKFLTNPNPDKSSPLYYRFLEYEELIKNLETQPKKR